MTKQRFHIYQLSRLAFAQVTEWDRIISELETGRNQMFWTYKPLRSGAFRLLNAGNDAEVEKIYRNVDVLAERSGGAKCASANRKALQVFENRFARLIDSPRDNYMEARTPGIDFAGSELIGGPHFSVLDKNRQKRFVYLHPSNWKHEQTEAFCELLAVVLEKKFDASARDLWFLDLRSEKRRAWPKSKPTVRRKCEQAAKLLSRLKNSNFEQGNE